MPETIGVCGLLVQPEMERVRSPLVSIPPFGGDFQGIRVYRSDEDVEAAQGAGSGAAICRLDQPNRLSLGMIASPQSPLPLRPARSLWLHHVHRSQLPDSPSSIRNGRGAPSGSG